MSSGPARGARPGRAGRRWTGLVAAGDHEEARRLARLLLTLAVSGDLRQLHAAASGTGAPGTGGAPLRSSAPRSTATSIGVEARRDRLDLRELGGGLAGEILEVLAGDTAVAVAQQGRAAAGDVGRVLARRAAGGRLVVIDAGDVGQAGAQLGDRVGAAVAGRAAAVLVADAQVVAAAWEQATAAAIAELELAGAAAQDVVAVLWARGAQVDDQAPADPTDAPSAVVSTIASPGGTLATSAAASAGEAPVVLAHPRALALEDGPQVGDEDLAAGAVARAEHLLIDRHRVTGPHRVQAHGAEARRPAEQPAGPARAQPAQ